MVQTLEAVDSKLQQEALNNEKLKLYKNVEQSF